jgi:hypothetical protein
MTKLISYSIGTYEQTDEGKEWVSVRVGQFDSDAQAELTVREIGPDGRNVPTDDDGEHLAGLYIRRPGAEWFCRF